MFVILKKKHTIFFSMYIHFAYVCHTGICYYFLATDSGFRTQLHDTSNSGTEELLIDRALFTIQRPCFSQEKKSPKS